jgi:hypothetical protein
MEMSFGRNGAVSKHRRWGCGLDLRIIHAQSAKFYSQVHLWIANTTLDSVQGAIDMLETIYIKDSDCECSQA